MKFNLNDFMQLDTKELLAVNGGTSCSSSSSSYSSSNSTNSSGTSNGQGSSTTISHGGPDGKPAYGSDGKSISYEYMYSSSSINNKNNSVNNEKIGASCSSIDLEKHTIEKIERKDGTTLIIEKNSSGTIVKTSYIDTKTGKTIGQEQAVVRNSNTNTENKPISVIPNTENTIQNSGIGTCGGTASSGVKESGAGSSNTSSTPTTMTNNKINTTSTIKESVEKHLNEKYIFGVNDCDIWVAKVLNDAGINIEKIWGSTNLTVDQHEKAMENILTDNPNSCWNIVLMTDSEKGSISHTGMIQVLSDGSVNYYDCSSNNSNKGSKWSWFKSVNAFEQNYGTGDSARYKDFDYYGL